MSIFGLKVIPKPVVLRPRPVPKLIDVRGPGNNTCGRIARHPYECHHVQYYEFIQKKRMLEDDIIEYLRAKGNEEAIVKKYAKHSEHKSYQRTLNDRVNKKMEEYDVRIDERRKKLSEIFWKEEREFINEVLAAPMKARSERIEEKIQKLNFIKTSKENERLGIVKEKRLQQYLGRCPEFRPLLVKERQNEVKQAQRIQIEENEAKRKQEDELEYFWGQMSLKYFKTMTEREEQERLRAKKLMTEIKTCSELQIQEKIGQEQKRHQETLEDCARLDKLREDMREEERLNHQENQRKKKELLFTLKDQIKEHKNILKTRRDQEQEAQRSYEKLADKKIAQAKAARQTKSSESMDNFKKYLAEIRKDRENEDRKTEKELQEQIKAIQKEEEDKKCKTEKAKKAALEAVMKGRENQIAVHKKREEELQKAVKMENQLDKESREYTNRLRQEYDFQNQLAAKKYREDLKQQIAYSQVLKDRENESMKKILDGSILAEEHYDGILSKALGGRIKICKIHPFQQAINEEKCLCLKPNY